MFPAVLPAQKVSSKGFLKFRKKLQVFVILFPRIVIPNPL
jgi:hypothetical protein